jgi:hypothetical protein
VPNSYALPEVYSGNTRCDGLLICGGIADAYAYGDVSATSGHIRAVTGVSPATSAAGRVFHGGLDVW